jgi:hypothetical protein
MSPATQRIALSQTKLRRAVSGFAALPARLAISANFHMTR